MSVEALVQLQHHVEALQWRELINLYPLIPIAFIGWLWRKLKNERSQRDGISPRDLEIDHVKPKWKGGTDAESNLRAVTRPEHAEKHFREASTTKDRKTAKAEYWAVSQIVQRMKPNEVKEFNQRISKKK